MIEALLRLENIKTHFPIFRGIFFRRQIASVRAVDGVSLEIKTGETLGLVGESGCGKTTLGRTIMQLVRATQGRVVFAEKTLNNLSPRELKKARREFQIIFQDPYASLNPRMTVFDALAEPLRVHRICPQDGVKREVDRLMALVGLSQRFIKKYPHEFSGGQRQRIAIARAIALQPKLLIADEAVSALDVSIQSQILNLLMDLKKQLGLTMIFISHDLSVVRHISDRIAIMYLGKIVECGETENVFRHPLHPYTQALLSAIPSPDPRRERGRERIFLEGDPPSPIHPPPGCSFAPRCPLGDETCTRAFPEFVEKENSHFAACFKV